MKKKKKNHERADPCRISCKGSYAVEAAFLFPILVLLFAFILLLSIHWYEAVKAGASEISALQELDCRTIFLNRSLLSQLTGDS